MKFLKRTALFITAAVIAACPMRLQAEELPDLNKKGSIEVTMKEDDKPIAGEELSLLQIAAAKTDDTPDNRGFSFAYTDKFTGQSLNLNDEKTVQASESANTLLAFAQKNKITGTTAVSGTDGVIRFKDLQTGLYLVLNSKPVNGYQTIDPFLVTVPVQIKDKEGKVTGYSYDVQANPKMEKLSAFEACAVADPPVQKKITGDVPSVKQRFLFTFKRLDSNSPLPVNNNGHVTSINGDTMTLYTDGAEQVEVGTISFSEPGDYTYEVREVNDGAAGYTYDTTVYWYKYEIRRDKTGKNLTAKRMLVKLGDENGKTSYDGDVNDTVVFTFTNEYKASGSGNSTPSQQTPESQNLPEQQTPAEPAHSQDVLPATGPSGSVSGAKLPQTGQLWWPVMLMAGCGTVCVALGVVLSHRKNRKDDRSGMDKS